MDIYELLDTLENMLGRSLRNDPDVQKLIQRHEYMKHRVEMQAQMQAQQQHKSQILFPRQAGKQSLYEEMQRGVAAMPPPPFQQID